MSTLDHWADALCAEPSLDPEDASQKTVLNLARVTAHTVGQASRAANRLRPRRCGRPRGPQAETAAKLQQLARR